MNKKNKKISILLTIILCFVFFISSSLSSDDKEEVTIQTVKPKPTKEVPVLLKKYSVERTRKVKHKLDSLLKRINKRNDFHGEILVAKGEKIIYQNEVGFADFKSKKLINKDSEFQIASVSKQFTAAAIMLLRERCLIELTDAVDTYFPGFPYKDVTIEHLLNHTAGLPKYFWLAEKLWNQKKAPINSEMMTLLESSNVQRFFKPGRNFDYSNTNYFVLASIVEKVSGISFASFLKNNIFDPLQMNHSYIYSFENDSIRKNQLFGYRLYRGWRHLKIGSTVNDAIVGDKNVYTTTEDLYKWTLGLNTEKILSKESLDLMYTKGKTIYGREVPYGFGFRVNTDGQKSIYHYGRWNGFSTGLTRYLDDDLVVIVLEHTSYRGMKSLNKKIKKIVTDNFSSLNKASTKS